MALSGLSDSSFFSQIATAIIFKKNNRTSSKIPHKIYDEKNSNRFLMQPTVIIRKLFPADYGLHSIIKDFRSKSQL
ncbi:hypothetical protein [Coprobacter secundus]|uniref:Uncharacterized protein n=1 Tax=Coprobacter secundus subsp. similis TaxID=2751153 RepID=A0A7G1HSE8_9BACT|nr:hypothetical protein [Coprobacter secundus]BCI62526.1 hypothetical protein Cop2CBH44_08790 [Coprobacter secundus subsp. similis]